MSQTAKSTGHTITAIFHGAGRSAQKTVQVHQAVIAGWTGRDKIALEKHIAELEKLGVKRPASTPVFYRVAVARLTTAEVMEASGPDSSGEVEFLLLQAGGKLWVGVGSDHTDRSVETYNVTVSKQMCDKPVAREFWDFDDLSDHWDTLILRSHIQENGERKLYQEGAVTSMLTPRSLLALWNGGVLEEGTLMYCGTLAAIGGIRPAPHFDFALEDPVMCRTIGGSYDMITLPIPG